MGEKAIRRAALIRVRREILSTAGACSAHWQFKASCVSCLLKSISAKWVTRGYRMGAQAVRHPEGRTVTSRASDTGILMWAAYYPKSLVIGIHATSVILSIASTNRGCGLLRCANCAIRDEPAVRISCGTSHSRRLGSCQTHGK